MIERMTHEEYVLSVRREAVEIAAGILSGDIPVLEGCHSLSALRWEVEVDERDPDFMAFAVISSEIDALPIGPVRAHWAPEALARLESEIQSAIAWATPQALPACKSVVQRFGV
jgi:hypothetical protein